MSATHYWTWQSCVGRRRCPCIIRFASLISLVVFIRATTRDFHFYSSLHSRSYRHGKSSIQSSWYGSFCSCVQCTQQRCFLFSIDINHDQRLDLNEFRNLIAQNFGPNAAIYTGDTAEAGDYIGGAYESSSSSAGTYGDVSGGNALYGGAANTVGTNIGNADLAGGQSRYSSYEQASYASSAGAGADGYDASTLSGANLAGATGAGASSSSFEVNAAQQQIQQYATNAQGLYQDPNPQIVRRPAPGGQVTYTQNIKIRFLQPPAVPPPGVSTLVASTVSVENRGSLQPLIIKEVRAPQPPPPPPLVIRQRAPPLPQPPPLILRERPPAIPASSAAQTGKETLSANGCCTTRTVCLVIRQLPALPIPPRSVIIERLPALPPKPRKTRHFPHHLNPLLIVLRWYHHRALDSLQCNV